MNRITLIGFSLSLGLLAGGSLRAADYTVVCFIDGKSWKPTRFTSPGTFELSTRGMPPGSYRVTLQLIDANGRVGSNTQTVRVK